MQFPYNSFMKIRVGDVTLPDPAEWSYQVGDLDTSGRRDATGLLHRKRVATKVNYEFSWNGLEWEMLNRILNAVKADKFKLTAPDPRTFDTAYTGWYYVGDRTGKAKYFLPGETTNYGKNQHVPGGKSEIAIYTLKLKFIEY